MTGQRLLVNRGGRLADAGDLDHDRIREHGVDRALDAGRDGRGEQERLALLGTGLHDTADARPEAHVEHAVGLVENEDLDLGEAHVVMLHEVDEAAGGGDEEVAALLERTNLLVELGAAHHDDGRLAGLRADLLRDVLDLRRELARGRDDEGVGLLGRGLALRLSDALERWQGEGAGLARAGLCAGEHVSAVENGGDGGCLDGSWLREAEGVDPGENLLV